MNHIWMHNCWVETPCIICDTRDRQRVNMCFKAQQAILSKRTILIKSMICKRCVSQMIHLRNCCSPVWSKFLHYWIWESGIIYGCKSAVLKHLCDTWDRQRVNIFFNSPQAQSMEIQIRSHTTKLLNLVANPIMRASFKLKQFKKIKTLFFKYICPRLNQYLYWK